MDRTSEAGRGGRLAVGLLLTLAVVVADAAPAAAASSVVHRGRKARTVALEPDGYGKVVLLVSGGREYKYYSFGPGRPLALRVTGPTTLSVLVRLLHDQTMKGTQDFSVRVEEEGPPGAWKEIGMHSLKGRKSPVATVKGEATLVPSRGETLVLTVPGGEHAYRLSLGAGGGAGGIARVRMPRKGLAAGSAPHEGAE